MPGPACLAASTPGQDEDADADDAADAERDEVPDPQGLLQGAAVHGGVGKQLGEGFRSEQAVSHLCPPVANVIP